MKNNMIKKEKGAIAIFVLIGLLFMSAFLILLFAGNINQEKDMKEQSNITSQIYSGEGEQGAYDQAFGDLRKKNKTTLTAEVENSGTLSLERTFGGNIGNYRIYGNSIQDGTPSPTNPVEIQSVGEKTKNLFNITDYVENMLNTKLGADKKKNAIYFNATDLEIGKTYTISFNKPIYWFKISNEADGYDSVEKYNAENGITQFTFTMTRNENISENATQYIIIGNPNADYKITAITDISQLDGYEIQIEEGETATAYEPYGYKIPVQVSGKNVFNSNESNAIKNKCEMQIDANSVIVKPKEDKLTALIYPLKLKKNTDYTVSGSLQIINPEEFSGSSCIMVRPSYSGKDQGGLGDHPVFDKQKLSSENIINYTFNSGEYETLYIWLYFQMVNNGTQKNGNSYGIYKNIQIEEGKTATSYEPYHASVTTNIYLNEPLRKLDEYADYIDFKTGKVVRPVKEKIFTGGAGYWSYWKESITSMSMGVWYARGEELGQYGEPIIKNLVGLSSHFVIQEQGGVNLPDDNLIGKTVIFANTKPPYFGFKVPYTTLDAWLQFLKDEYSTNHPVRVHYVLLKPTEEIISLPELPAFEDYSKIEVLTQIPPSKIEAEYEGYTIE